MLAVKINANNSASGNPRRGWLVYELSGKLVGFVDEGYEGIGALRKAFPGAKEAGGVDIPVSASFYNTVKKAGEERSPSASLIRFRVYTVRDDGHEDAWGAWDSERPATHKADMLKREGRYTTIRIESSRSRANIGDSVTGPWRHVRTVV